MHLFKSMTLDETLMMLSHSLWLSYKRSKMMLCLDSFLTLSMSINPSYSEAGFTEQVSPEYAAKHRTCFMTQDRRKHTLINLRSIELRIPLHCSPIYPAQRNRSRGRSDANIPSRSGIHQTFRAWRTPSEWRQIQASGALLLPYKRIYCARQS